MLTLGVDPGLTNTGLALLDAETGNCLRSAHVCFKDRSLKDIVGEVEAFLGNDLGSVQEAYIERYVAYEGKHNAASEDILMIIGAISLWLQQGGIPVLMCRAIDWKPALCKLAVRSLAFDNPSDRFDKKFSMALAACLTGNPFKTDHEADAACIGSLYRLRKA